MRVLYSFPYRIGRTGVGHTAWQQVNHLARDGVSVVLYCGKVERDLPPSVEVHENLVLGRLKLPMRLLGPMGTPLLHDLEVARYLRATGKVPDLVHGWPLGSAHTFSAAAKRRVPTVLENCNSHIRNIVETLQPEYDRLGLRQRPRFLRDVRWVARHEVEYQRADFLACPSDFVADTFLARGYLEAKLLRTQYGCDDAAMVRGAQDTDPGFKALFLGHGEPRKGLHHLLQAWGRASLPSGSQLSIAGSIEPNYMQVIQSLAANEGVTFEGFVTEPARLLRQSHVLVVPSLEEGSALVTYEARTAASCSPPRRRGRWVTAAFSTTSQEISRPCGSSWSCWQLTAGSTPS
ncbi:glycosyltransferase family 4 protein [Devosia sp.]|uniref:glycosyltransferase family 4 protein n=1 Tax=Devosia sp. TaxID=1871048 RepID=UPI001AC2EF33|nr:glycosyltransferase family 4 protein [Devosia sp.]MBN9311276.1 glycosyltransferase family 4 protein [Devosia sp.]